jgi:hypothetical protein
MCDRPEAFALAVKVWAALAATCKHTRTDETYELNLRQIDIISTRFALSDSRLQRGTRSL